MFPSGVLRRRYASDGVSDAAATAPWSAWPGLLRRRLAPRALRAASRVDLRTCLVVVVAATAWRIISALSAFIANVVFPLAQPRQFTVGERPHPFWDAFARWDSGWYFGIARNGYEFIADGRNNLAFFPAYPLSMGYVGHWLGGGQANYYYAGIIISWTAFVLAMAMLFRLARLDLDRDASVRACVFCAVYPFAFIFGMVYPSSLFLLSSVAAVFAFRTGRWVLGALAGALTTATRVNGILIWPVLALIVYACWRSDPRQLRRALAALCVVPAGLLAYATFVYVESGSFLEFAASIQRWDYHPGGAPWAAFADLFGKLSQPYRYLTTDANAPYELLNGTAALGALVATPFIWRRFGAAYAALVLLNLALPLSSGKLEGLGRYTAVMFPISLWLATFRNPYVHAAMLCGFGMLYMLCQSLFVTLHPIY